MRNSDRFARTSGIGYADLPPGVGFELKDEPLRRDINLLGRVLGPNLARNRFTPACNRLCRKIGADRHGR
jgi:hypothetical protein